MTSKPPSAAPLTETATAKLTLVTLDEVGVDIHEELVSNTITGHAAGDTVEYTITVTNQGTTTLREILVSTPLLGDDFECDSDLESLRLSPGARVECIVVAEVNSSSCYSWLMSRNNGVLWYATLDYQQRTFYRQPSHEHITRIAEVTSPFNISAAGSDRLVSPRYQVHQSQSLCMFRH